MSTPDEQRSRMFRLSASLACIYKSRDNLDASTLMAQIQQAPLPSSVKEFVEILKTLSEAEQTHRDVASMIANLRSDLCHRFDETYMRPNATPHPEDPD
ncbi:MAG: hypothetical protein D6812_12390 [Deltaproteobacteria bacterium]|nr:MAG: hypothetical protein D6812_12390 [Deltaproteobacteria bacterium]